MPLPSVFSSILRAPLRTPVAVAALACVLLLSGCGFFKPAQDPTRDWSERRLYEAAKSALAVGDYENAVDLYQKLGARYPFGPIAEQGQVELAYTYYKHEKPDLALATVDRFIKEHPRHPTLDYAFYLRGLVNYTRGDGFVDRFLPKDRSRRDTSPGREAFTDFQQVVTRYPDSIYAEDSAQRMQYLKGNIAMQEVHVARYYLRRRAYVAAAARARYVLENYQGTEAVPEALIVLARSYRTLGLDDLYEDTLRVLELNYGEDAQYEREIERVKELELS